MKEIVTILVLTVAQFAMGFSFLSFFKLKMKPFMAIALSVLLGVAFFSLAVFALILLKTPLTYSNIIIALAVVLLTCIAIGNKNIIPFFKSTMQFKFGAQFLYELPAICLLAFMIFVSAWRCYYFPPTPRDLTSGPELMAEYAIKEKTIANSMFSVNLESTNNQFKSPFISALQIIYKYVGFPFGQIWLSSIFLFFVMFLYQALSKHIHNVLAGLLLVYFVSIPEMYAYTIMALFDYSNAVFFTIGLYFLFEFAKFERNYKSLLLAGVFLAISVYVRNETLVLVAFATGIFAIQQLFAKAKLKNIATKIAFLAVPSLILYFLSGSLYLNNYLPQKYDVAGLINNNLGNLNPFFTRLTEMFSKLIYGEQGSFLYGTFTTFFIVLFVVDIILKKGQLSKEAVNWVIGIVIVVFGLAFLGYLLPLMDLNNSTKRGLFKLFPLLLLYMMHSHSLKTITTKLKI